MKLRFHFLTSAADVMSLANWKCLPLAVSVVEQQTAAAFSASQLRDLALLTVGQKDFLSSIGVMTKAECFLTSIVEGLLQPATSLKGQNNNSDDCVLFDELALPDQVSILVTCEGKVKAKVSLISAVLLSAFFPPLDRIRHSVSGASAVCKGKSMQTDTLTRLSC